MDFPEEINKNCKTFSDALNQNIPATQTVTDFKQIIKEDRNKQLVQERERNLRAANIIVHGVTDVANDAEEENYDNFVNAFLEKIGANTKPVSITHAWAKVTQTKHVH